MNGAEQRPIEPDAVNATDGSARKARGSYGQILHSSALIGGSQFIGIMIRLVRTKAMALLLGPSGIGLMGLLAAIEDLAIAIVSMGLRMSGVRQIADAASRADQHAVGRTVTVLRRTSVVLGCIGAMGMILLCRPIATLTFGDERQAYAVALLGVSVLFRVVSNGQTAVIHGLRRIGDLAKLEPLGALLGAIASVAIVWALGEEGVAPAAVATAGLGLAVSWLYSRRVKLVSVAMTMPQVHREGLGLLRLGTAFMVNGLMTLGATYVIRTIVLRHEGLDGAGLYQAAFALGSLYVGVLLQAMGSDFYPRLVGAANDDEACNRLINEQAHVSMLLAGPGMAVTVALAPLLVPLFYSSKFVEAVPIVQWICAGMALRVIIWPMGMLMLAKNTQLLFIASETAWTSLGVLLAWLLVDSHGIFGAGVAFFATEVFHLLMTYPIARRLSNFRWNDTNWKLIVAFCSLLVIVLGAFQLLPTSWAIALGLMISGAAWLLAIRVVSQLVPLERLPTPVRRLLSMIQPSAGNSYDR